VVAALEHPSTIAVYRSLEAEGRLEVSWVPASEEGRVEPALFLAALTERSVLASLMHANNETGVVQDLEPVARGCRERGVALHCDAVQSLGKIPLAVAALGADLVTVSAHKVHGPRACGALWIRRGARFRHPHGGGPQERGLRPGMENLASAAGFACALERLELARPALRDRLWARIQASVSGVVRNGRPEWTVPNTLNVSLPGLSAELLLVRLDLAGVAASAGAACASGAREPSHVLRAMGMPEERISSALRFSLGRGTTADDVDRAAESLAAAVAELRAAPGKSRQ
jgi:cysteine desulfurase